MTDFSPWLRPTLAGPFLTSWAYVVLSITFAGALVLPSGERIDALMIGLLVISFFASMIVVMLLIADVGLLRARACRLPIGARAWTSSMLAPIAVWLLWTVFGVSDESIPMLVLTFAWPLAVGPLVTRWVLGAAPT